MPPEALGAVAGDHVAAADQGDLLAELLGFLEVVSREQDRRPLAVELADVAPQLHPQLEVAALPSLWGGRLWRPSPPRSSKSPRPVGSPGITGRGGCISARAGSSRRRMP